MTRAQRYDEAAVEFGFEPMGGDVHHTVYLNLLDPTVALHVFFEGEDAAGWRVLRVGDRVVISDGADVVDLRPLLATLDGRSA